MLTQVQIKVSPDSGGTSSAPPPLSSGLQLLEVSLSAGKVNRKTEQTRTDGALNRIQQFYFCSFHLKTSVLDANRLLPTKIITTTFGASTKTNLSDLKLILSVSTTKFC